MYEFLFEPCILKCYEFLFEAWIFLMYFKIPYDFTILRSVFTIRVCFAFSVPSQNHDFNNLDHQPLPSQLQATEKEAASIQRVHLKDK